MTVNPMTDMSKRKAWLITALVVVGLGAAGLYANQRGGSDVPKNESVVQAPVGGADTETATNADAETATKDVPERDQGPSGKGLYKGPARAPVGKPDGQATKPQEAVSEPPTSGPDRYGRESYEGAPPSQAPGASHPDRYGDRESYEGVPPKLAPDTRGGGHRGN